MKFKSQRNVKKEEESIRDEKLNTEVPMTLTNAAPSAIMETPGEVSSIADSSAGQESLSNINEQDGIPPFVSIPSPTSMFLYESRTSMVEF